MIYFVQAEDGGPIKIGFTERLRERHRNLAAEYCKPLRVLAVTDGMRAEEKALHERFAHLRQTGEWFHPADDLKAYITSECRPWDGADEVRQTTVGMRLTKEYKDWLRECARCRRREMVDVIVEALEEYADRHKFEPPPKR